MIQKQERLRVDRSFEEHCRIGSGAAIPPRAELSVAWEAGTGIGKEGHSPAFLCSFAPSQIIRLPFPCSRVSSRIATLFETDLATLIRDGNTTRSGRSLFLFTRAMLLQCGIIQTTHFNPEHGGVDLLFTTNGELLPIS
jgi:hypothetical protein